MNQVKDVARTLKALFSVLPAARRRKLWALLLLMFTAAVAEVVSLGALVPFLTLLADRDGRGPAVRLVHGALASLGFGEANAALTLTIVFVAIAIIAAIVRVTLNIAVAKTNFRIGHELGSEIYRRALFQSYEYHVAHNSSEIVGGVLKVDIAVVVILAVLVGASSCLMAVFIGVTIFVVNPTVAMIAVFGFGGTYALISRLSHQRLLANGRVINSTTPTRLQAMQEGLGGIRDILLDQTQEFHRRRFDGLDSQLRLAQESNAIIGPTPRFVIEAIGMVVVAVLGYHFYVGDGGIVAAIPTLGVLVLGGQRLLPMLQQTYQGWMMIAGHLKVITDVTDLLAQPQPETPEPFGAPLAFDKQIELLGVGFGYAGVEGSTLTNVSVTIPKGARVGIIGPTGSGKSTLLNLVMGLLEPTSGTIMVDGTPISGKVRTAWQRNVAHVPQSIFLADATILENVAFGVARQSIDVARVTDSLRRAQLAEFVHQLPNGCETVVGEDGVRLSGGQRQRIGIARALYKQASVLVLDEATSALDQATEAELMKAVNGLKRDITLIMIAHRLSTLQACDFLLRIDAGTLRATATYKEVLVAIENETRTKVSQHESQ